MNKFILSIITILLFATISTAQVRINRALCLDGENNDLCLGMDILHAPWTLEAWIKGNDSSWKDVEVIFGGNEYSELKYVDHLPLVIKDGKLHSNKADLWSPEKLDDKWHHVALTCDKNDMTLFLDGKAVDKKQYTTATMVGSLGIHLTLESAFAGLMDEVRVWSDALSPKVIQEWMGRPVERTHPSFKDLKAYFNFDDDIDQTAVNWVGKGHQPNHIRNYRKKYKNKTPFAYTVQCDNPHFSIPFKQQELFNSVVIESEWDVDQGATDDQIAKLRVIVTGEQNPLYLNKLELDLSACSDLNDISQIHVYYTGKKARGEIKREIFGNGIQPQQTILLENENLLLTPGVNYILVTADIKKEATPDNTIRFNIPSFTLNGKSYTPETTQDMLPKKITQNPEYNPDLLRVLNWNIFNAGMVLGEKGVERIIDLARAVNPDIITMQEGYGSQERIAQALGLHMQTSKEDANLALFSKYPIKPLPTERPFYSNPGIIELPNGHQILANGCWLYYSYNPTYTGFYPDTGLDPALWLAEDSMRPMSDVSLILNNDTKPYEEENMSVIIGGDFNSCSHLDWTKESAHLHYGYGPVNFPVSRYMMENGYVDSFREINPDEVARPEGTFAVIFTHLQTNRIDFIYYKSNKIKAVNSKIIRTAPEIDDIWASDHAAVLTTFMITNEP